MKALPCPICKDTARLPDGKPYHLQTHPRTSGPFHYRCFRCKHRFAIGASEFSRLPDVETRDNRDETVTELD